MPPNADTQQPFLSRLEERKRIEAMSDVHADRQESEEADATTEELRQLVEEDEAEHARNDSAGESSDDSPAAIREARDNPREYAAGRSAELQSMLPEARRGRITMGVGIGTDVEGGTRVVIGTSEDNGYIRKPLQPRDGEEIAEGKGHAETSILDYMAGREIQPSHIAAGRPICPPCADRVDAAGADPASPLREVKDDHR